MMRRRRMSNMPWWGWLLTIWGLFQVLVIVLALIKYWRYKDE
jgi:hypothetical protein